MESLVAPRTYSLHVETRRLLLRELQESDIIPMHRMESRPEVARFHGVEPKTEEEVEDNILNRACRCRIDSRRLGKGKATLWYTIDTPFQRNGYGAEALGGFIEVLCVQSALKVEVGLGEGEGETNLVAPVSVLQLEIDTRNIASQALAARLNFRYVEQFTEWCKGDEVEMMIWRRLLVETEDLLAAEDCKIIDALSKSKE
ncbi:Uu.00g097650.m01.CDS01 [Anthostomella pinea]|uniref:Uu.00g097650.m01.CDS01 n=1 Tax=Anthostomella pinea TaxID=933095 RepID=A0AAI8VCI9_9PEZI|nr:Uu.00g097650.m01.CDS01 [Anthostomella pinea]